MNEPRMDLERVMHHEMLGKHRAVVEALTAEWRTAGNVHRLWCRDATLWRGGDEASWLGWLDIVETQKKHADLLANVARKISELGPAHVVLLGMGGSSLFPDVLAHTFGRQKGAPQLLVLDSTDPAQVEALARRIDPATTIFIVASKSGSTAEPNAFKAFFHDRVMRAVGKAKAGRHFVAITDPGSSLDQLAKEESFLATYAGVPSIGGRYSALSHFGMVPAAAMGLDAVDLLARAEVMVRACGAEATPETNPGVRLGLIMGALARAGRDKLTLVTSPGIERLGAWIEQLVAESSGKQGKGIVPIDGEPLAAPASYDSDRLFVYTRLASALEATQDARVEALAAAGHPVVRIDVRETRDLGQEIFRWEMATAVACAVLGVNAFDQPDVEAAKVATRKLKAAYEDTGRLPETTPFAAGAGLSLYAGAMYAEELVRVAGGGDVAALLRAHVAKAGSGDYFAINAFIEMNAAHMEVLTQLRARVRDHKHVATTVGFGPRFLHSTGQLHKGGANNGVFLQLTADSTHDLPIPGDKATFGVLLAAQALGDFEVLVERKRRALRVHLGADVPRGLATIAQAIA